MKKFKLIFVICGLAIIGVITLQLFWLNNYNKVNKERFANEVQNLFEEAIAKEVELRADTAERLFYEYLMDTSRSVISSEKDTAGIYKYKVLNTKNKKIVFFFSPKRVNIPIDGSDTAKQIVAKDQARAYREDDFEKHMLYFIRGDSINAFLRKIADRYLFDEKAFAGIFSQKLKQKGINEPFELYFLDKKNDPASMKLLKDYFYVTYSSPTYKNEKDFNFVVAAFRSPNNYLKTKLILLIAGSVLLFITVGFALYYLVRVIFQEKRLSVVKNDFISNISHEFKTPIATASAAIEGMEKFNVLENPERTKRYLAASKHELERLSDLVNKILEISLYEKRQVSLKKENVDVAEMITSMLYNFSLIRNSGTQIHLDNTCDNAVIKADKVHLYNSISNIIDNALKYGGAEVIVNIQITCTRQELVIAIKDNGPGIRSQNLPHIFDKFYRISSQSEYKIKGFGLGLYYTRSIIEEHGGWCKVESEWGKGTTFKIGLPK